jgi:hypothetical protein
LDVIDDADDGVVYGDKGDGHGLGGFATAHDEDQLFWASLEGGIGGNHRLAFWLLLFGQGLDDQEFDAFQTFIFLGGYYRADYTC